MGWNSVWKKKMTAGDWETDWERRNRIFTAVRQNLHTKIDIQYFPCVVEILCHFQCSASSFAEEQTRGKYYRITFSKSNWIFQTCPCVVMFYFSLFLPQGPPGMSGGVGQPGLVGEKVSILHLTAALQVPVHMQKTRWCLCVFYDFILPSDPSLSGWGRRSWRSRASWRAWCCCQSLQLHLTILKMLSYSPWPFSDCHFTCWYCRVLKVMWGRRVTLARLVQLGLQDPEEHQEKMVPKATLWVTFYVDQ